MSAGIVVVGSVHTDFVATAPRLPERDETVRGDRFDTHPGGKGGNQAIQAALLGHPTTLVGRVGDDWFGRRLIEALQRKGVDTGHIRVDPDAPTGASTVLVGEEGDYASIVALGAGGRMAHTDIDSARSTFAQARVALVQLELDLPITAYAADMARQAGAFVVLNASPVTEADQALVSALSERVDVVVVNQGEARRLAARCVAVEAEGPLLAKALRRRLGVPAVVVTVGATGAVLCDGGGDHVFAGFDVPVVDTIGAGDAFVATVAGRLAAGSDLPSAVAVANAAGALAVTRAGAYDAFPTEAELRRFFREHGRAGFSNVF